MEKYSEKSIVIEIKDPLTQLDAGLFRELHEKYHNFKLIINIHDELSLAIVQKEEIPFFFSNFATSIDKLHGYMNYHPTDMYVCEELGFALENVSKILHDNNIKVRVFPNICQSSYPTTPSLHTFFVRPDDMKVYSNFVDVFEIISDQQRQPIIYKIYKEGKWFGDIAEIIPTFKGKLDGRFVLPNFAITRVQCMKRCMYRPGSCAICDKYSDLAIALEKGEIAILPRKEKVDF